MSLSDRVLGRDLNADQQNVRREGAITAAMLGVFVALMVLAALVGTSKLSPPDLADATCLLPLLARAHARADSIEHALSMCDATAEQAEAVWSAHVEAERIEGFVPRRQP